MIVCITLIMLVGIFFRIWDIKNTPPGLWSDEAMNGVNAIEALENKDWKIFYPENFGREGLFINIQSVFIKFLGTEPWVLRLPSAIFGIFTVLGLFLMTKELFSARIALFASFFLATSFWHINFSRIGFRAIMAPFFLVWSFYFLFRAINKDTSQNLRDFRPELLMAVAGLFFGLGVHSYIAYRIAPIIALFPLWKWLIEVRLPSESDGSRTSINCAPCLIGLFIFTAFVAALPLLWYYAQNPLDFMGRTTAVSIFNSKEPLGQLSENIVKTLQMFNFFGDFNWRHNYAGSPQLWWPIGLLFLMGIWYSVKKSFENWKLEIKNSLNKFSYRFVLLWFTIMLLPVVISNEGLPHALRAIILIPPAMIFAALGFEWIILHTQNKFKLWILQYPQYSNQLMRIQKELIILLMVFLFAATTHAFNQYFLRWAQNPKVAEAFQTDLTEKARWIKNQPKNIKKIVVTGETDQIDLRGSPMSIEPIVFITNAFFANDRLNKNIFYKSSKEISSSDCSESCIIIPLESDARLYGAIKSTIPNIKVEKNSGFVVFRK